MIVICHIGKRPRCIKAVFRHDRVAEIKILLCAGGLVLAVNARFVHAVGDEPVRHAVGFGNVLPRSLTARADDGKIRLVGDKVERRAQSRREHQRRLGAVHTRAENNDALRVFRLRVGVCIADDERFKPCKRRKSQAHECEQDALPPLGPRTVFVLLQHRKDDPKRRQAPEQESCKAHAGDSPARRAEHGTGCCRRPQSFLSLHGTLLIRPPAQRAFPTFPSAR